MATRESFWRGRKGQKTGRKCGKRWKEIKGKGRKGGGEGKP